MAVYKANVQSSFVTLMNSTAQDSRLSLDARGMILYMASKPQDWKFHNSQMMVDCNIGRDKLNRIFNELVNYGYLAVMQTHDELGQFKERDLHFFAEPAKNPLFIDSQPCTEKPYTGKPLTVNPHLQKKESLQKKEKQNEQTNLLETGFDIFWKNWHNKKAKDKAKLAFEKAAKPLLKKSEDDFKSFVEEITSYAVERMTYIKQQREDNQYYFDDGFPKIHPTTYLNNARWKDEYRD